jgi:uncharacterized protein YbjT (DUF2867 family)
VKKAMLFGASGLIGSYLLIELLNDRNYGEVIIVVRKSLDITHPKLQVLLADYNTFATLIKGIAVDNVFLCLGTTRKDTPDKKKYYELDHDYPVLAARIARENGASSVFVVTAVGANATSKVFYIKTKGKVEQDIIALGYAHTHIFRPSMLIGNRREHRPTEKLLLEIWPFIDPLLPGSLNRYHSIKVKEVAKAMINAAKKSSQKIKIYQWKEMNDLL